ncbi:thioredoxin [Anaerosporobacter sp.]|uniref:thioredoxin n=1 Tax=Anaerosporobacter sp. TaxID=1872529 RepID=UPI00286F9166|nr:thioredoxin [Anaerosporobacter sp.]
MANILTVDSFNEKVKKEGVAIVDFFATWCGPCKMLAPVFEEVSSELNDRAGFYKVDIDESMELASEYRIQSVPTMLVFKDGEVVDKVVGFTSKAALKEKVESQL